LKIEITWPTQDHADHIAEHLRDIDKIEAWAMHRLSPVMAVNGSIFLSEYSYTVLADDEPILVFGVQQESLLSDTGVVWLLATDGISKIKKSFVKQCQKVFLDLIQEYQMVYNYVYTENKIALRWLKWLGFEIHEPKMVGAMGIKFHRVEYRRQ
jgi:hypothetical protein